MGKNFWKSKQVLVTGGAGFIGSHVVEKLLLQGANVTVLDNLENGNQENLQEVKKNMRLIIGDCRDAKTAQQSCKHKDVVLNMAAKVGGIEYNRTHQGTMLNSNLLISTTMIEAARKMKVEHFLIVSSACVYPRNCSIPTPEEEGFLSEPEPTNGGYGWAKRMAEKLGMYYNQQFGMKVAIVRPYNAYGPRDHFDKNSSHVIPALIKRIFDGENPLSVWGSGRQTRSFIYVDDLARGILLAVERRHFPGPINLGTDEEISIGDLARLIVSLSSRKPKIVFDTSKPDGSPRRNCDNSKARKILGFTPMFNLNYGLQKTISWYREHGKKN